MKKKKVSNAYDYYMEDKANEVQEAKFHLMNVVNSVIIKKEVIDIYPNGADKKKAVQDFEQEQHRLICAIGHYDSVLSNYKRYYDENFSKFQLAWDKERFCSSHLLIEIVYQNFYKRA